MTGPLRRRVPVVQEAASPPARRSPRPGRRACAGPAASARGCACRSSMLNRQVRSPSWMRGSKSRGTAMSRITIVPPVRRARIVVEAPPRHDRLRRAGRAQDDVGLRPARRRAAPTAPPGRRSPAATACAFSGLRLVTRMRCGCSSRRCLQRQLAHLAGADDQDRLVVEVVEHLADVIDGDAGDRDVAAGDAGLGADALGDDVGVLEQGVQQRPGGRRAPGPARRPASPGRRSGLRRRSGCRGWRRRGTDGGRRRASGGARRGAAGLSSSGMPWNSRQELGDQVGVGQRLARRRGPGTARRGCRC